MLNINKSHYTQAETNLAEIMVQGFVFACPFNNSLDSCPFNSLMQCPTEVRFANAQKLENSEVLTLYQAHSDCLRAREMRIK